MRLVHGLVVALLFASVAHAGDYELAIAKAKAEDKPLVVIVSAEWCIACHEMKSTIDSMKQGELKDAVVVVVDYDKDQKNARHVMRGETLPQIAVYRFKNAWQRVHAVGKQTRLKVLELVRKLKD